MRVKKQQPDNHKADANLEGDHARDTHREGYGDDYARDSDAPGSAADADTYASPSRKGEDEVHIGKASE